MDYAANLALFLTEKTGSCIGKWAGHLSAKEQKEIIGRFIGKGKIWINGNDETIEHHRKVCFGTDTECTFSKTWKEL